jgi:hypothetical protein
MVGACAYMEFFSLNRTGVIAHSTLKNGLVEKRVGNIRGFGCKWD